jgi:anti-sigma B factor antagonist
MKIDVQQTAGVSIIRPQGKITIAGGDVMLRQEVERVLAAGGSRILVNLRKVTAMDSSGLGELLAARRHIEERGGRIVLLDIDHRTASLMSATRLVGLFEIHDDESAALASLVE